MNAARTAVLLIGWALAGCSAATVRYADRSVSSEVLHERVEENHTRLKALLGSGTISFETPDIAQSGSFELKLRKPDSVLVHIEGPFGIDVGSALLTREEFLFYNSFKNRLVSGPMSPENLGKILAIDLSFDDMLNLFSGGVFFRDDYRTPSSSEVVDDEIVLTYHHSRGTRRYWIDPTTLQITKIHHLDATGKPVFEQLFGKFRTIDGVTVPQYVRLTMHRERRRVSIAYADLSVNPSDLDFQFEIPANASRARLQP